MTFANTANSVRAAESLLCLAVQHQGTGIKCCLWLLNGDELASSLGSAQRSHPCIVPLFLAPLSPRQQAIHPKVSVSGQPQLPSMACTHPSVPNQEWEHQLPWGTVSYSSVSSSTKCSVTQWHTTPPSPTVLTGAGGNLGNRCQQKRVEQIETSQRPASQAVHQGEGREGRRHC